MEKISVCIPAYNEEKLIRRCLESVSFQQGVDITEILVGINSSTDQTRKIVEEYTRIDSRVRIVDSPKGKANAWNALNSVAFNNLRIFQDGDSIALKDSYKNLLYQLNDNDIIGASIIRENSSNDVLAWFLGFPKKYASTARILNGSLYLMNYSKISSCLKEKISSKKMPSDIINDDVFLDLIASKIDVAKNVFISISVEPTISGEIKRQRRMLQGNLLLRKNYPNLSCVWKTRNWRDRLADFWLNFFMASFIEKLIYLIVAPCKALIYCYIFLRSKAVDLSTEINWK